MSKEKVEKFLDKVKKLESFVRSRYNLSKEKSVFPYLNNTLRWVDKTDMENVREVRNLLSHSPKMQDEYIITPSDCMIDFLDKIIQWFENRQTCMKVATSKSKLYTQTLEGNVLETMNTMKENKYTYVPVLEDDRVIGVFDENSLFQYLAEDGIVCIDEKLTLSDIKQYLSLEREMEKFDFVNRNLYVDELQERFSKDPDVCKHVGAVFVTENGKYDEKILGMLTLWDIVH